MNNTGKREQWLQWAMELQALAQAGLTYSKDVYDLERFERIRQIAAEIISAKSDIPLGIVKDLFLNEKGYQTPKIDTRAAIFEDGKILLVQEKDGRWTLPGGWCDVDISVAENTVKEVREEAGLDVRTERIIAVQDRARHNRPPPAHGICKIFVLCKLIGGQFEDNSETIASGYFGLDGLPVLSADKTSYEQIKMCFAAAADENWQPLLD